MTEFTERDALLGALGAENNPLTSIDFNEYPNMEVIPTQYSALRVTFTDQDAAFVQDGYGIGGSMTKLHIHLDTHDATAIGA